MKKFVFLLLAVPLVFSMLCVSEESNVITYEPEKDGGISILEGTLPSKFGMIITNGEEVFVGKMVGGDNVLISRAVFSFNLENWTGSNLKLKIRCTHVYGNPGNVEVYVLDNFNLNDVNMSDVSEEWDKFNEAILIGEMSLSEGWNEIVISNDTISGNSLIVGIKLSNEEINENNFYMIAAREYGINRNTQATHLEEIS